MVSKLRNTDRQQTNDFPVPRLSHSYGDVDLYEENADKSVSRVGRPVRATGKQVQWQMVVMKVLIRLCAYREYSNIEIGCPTPGKKEAEEVFQRTKAAGKLPAEKQETAETKS